MVVNCRFHENGREIMTKPSLFFGDEVMFTVDPCKFYRTDDCRDSWPACGSCIHGYQASSASRLAIHPSDSDRLLMATRGLGVQLSEGSYLSWIPINNGLSNLFVNTVAIDSQNPDIVYAGTDGGDYVSLNGGEQKNNISIE